jgi:hypothetical protein
MASWIHFKAKILQNTSKQSNTLQGTPKKKAYILFGLPGIVESLSLHQQHGYFLLNGIA